MTLRIYEIDAFVGEKFHGNPAGVCFPETEISDQQMQHVAAGLGLPETAFVFPRGDGWAIRWFTPTVEVDLCGHATLATAWVLSEQLGHAGPFRFDSRSGELAVRSDPPLFTLDFPAQEVVDTALPALIEQALGDTVVEQCLRAQVPGGNWLIRLSDEAAVRDLQPDLALLATLPEGGVIVTAAGETCDFVSRFFAPNYGIPEDHVTGSAHCALTPYWSERLGRRDLQAQQLSPRGGELHCAQHGERVHIGGRARMAGSRELPL